VFLETVNNCLFLNHKYARYCTLKPASLVSILRHMNSLYTTSERNSYLSTYCLYRGRVAQLVQRLATGWTVRGSNPGGGEIFRTRPDRPWGQPSLLYNGYRVFPGGKATDAWYWLSNPFYRRGQGRVELYLYPPLARRFSHGVPLPLLFICLSA
jgi:hypothetical protein